MMGALAEDLDPAPSGLLPAQASSAPIALAETEQMGAFVSPHAGQPFQALVWRVERKVEPGTLDVAELMVVLVHLSHETGASPRHRLDEGEEAIAGPVVGEVF